MAGRVLKVLEDQGLLRATGKTIVVFGARPKMRTKPMLAARTVPQDRTVRVEEDEDDEDDEDEE
jgi:CRP/FNR family cyclic AMP-dependent transcriptional regulator